MRIWTLESRAAVSTSLLMALTILHHLYGASLYAAPFRRHALIIGAPVLVFILALLHLSARAPGRATAWAAWSILLGPVFFIGAFEGGYNHMLKIFAFSMGAPAGLLAAMFPAPIYEPPSNPLFEVSGLLQTVFGAWAARDALRLLPRSAKSAS